MRRLLATLAATALAAGALVLTSIPAQAQTGQCDHMTGNGSFSTTANQAHLPATAEFNILGGCRDGSPTWGHFEYIDEGNALNLTWTSMTAYIWAGDDAPDAGSGQPRGTRIICGTATTNLFGDVDFGVVAHDGGEPNVDDVFIIRLRKAGHTVYTTENPQANLTLSGSTAHIQLHKPTSRSNGGGNGNIQIQQATSGSFGGSCIAFF
jgi:hypothetical protein